MKAKNEFFYNKIIERMSKLLLSIISLCIFYFLLFLQLEKQYELIFIFIGFLLEVIFLPYFLMSLIENSINIRNDIKILSTFCTNMFFIHHSTMFILSNKFYNNIIFQILTVIALIIVIIRICRDIKIDKDSDLSILKSMNLFFVAGITMIIYILKLNKISIIKKIEDWLNFYYLLPFLIAQGMYELLDGRAK
jgi:hypothetical protein